MAGVEEKRWTKGDWRYHLRPGVDSEAVVDVFHLDTLMMQIEGSSEFCRAVLLTQTLSPPRPGDYRCRVVELSPPVA